MKEKNLLKVKQAKQVFTERGIIFRELANGHLQVDTANFWATSDKWHDSKSGEKGAGINSFIKFLKDNNII